MASSFLNRLGGKSPAPSPTNGYNGSKKRSPTLPSAPYFPPSPLDSPAAGSVPPLSAASTGGKALYLCAPFVNALIIKGSLRKITNLPKYVNAEEWVAANMVDFFHNINLFLGAVADECTRESCPTMRWRVSWPHLSVILLKTQQDYTWTTGPSKKQVKVPAPQYIDFVLSWAEKIIGDEAIFPTKAGREFAQNFAATARHLYTQFLRIFAHLYHAHFATFVHLSLEAHLNSLFAHFLVFGLTFDLLDPKECRAPRDGWGFVVGDLLDVRDSRPPA